MHIMTSLFNRTLDILIFWSLLSIASCEEIIIEEEVGVDEPLFGVLDIILQVTLLGIAGWWLMKSKSSDDSASQKSYSIQPTTLGSSVQNTDNSFIKKLKTSGRSLVAFYGSQTGTGEEFAGRIAKEGICYGLKGMVADPEEYDMCITGAR